MAVAFAPASNNMVTTSSFPASPALIKAVEPSWNPITITIHSTNWNQDVNLIWQVNQSSWSQQQFDTCPATTNSCHHQSREPILIKYVTEHWRREDFDKKEQNQPCLEWQWKPLWPTVTATIRDDHIYMPRTTQSLRPVTSNRIEHHIRQLEHHWKNNLMAGREPCWECPLLLQQSATRRHNHDDPWQWPSSLRYSRPAQETTTNIEFEILMHTKFWWHFVEMQNNFIHQQWVSYTFHTLFQNLFLNVNWCPCIEKESDIFLESIQGCLHQSRVPFLNWVKNTSDQLVQSYKNITQESKNTSNSTLSWMSNNDPAANSTLADSKSVKWIKAVFPS